MVPYKPHFQKEDSQLAETIDGGATAVNVPGKKKDSQSVRGGSGREGEDGGENASYWELLGGRSSRIQL